LATGLCLNSSVVSRAADCCALRIVFVNHEVEDHKADINDAKAMRGAAKDPQVKALLEKSLPELQKHLDRAQKLAAARK
jgi:hypothetical protein